MSWDWKLIAFNGRVSQVLNVDQSKNIFYAAVPGTQSEADSGRVGLYQSLDSCQTWQKISDFNCGSLFYHQRKDYLVVGAAEASEVHIYRNANKDLKGRSPDATFVLPMELGEIVAIDGLQTNAFETAVYVAQLKGVTYTDSILDNPPTWKSLTQANGGIPRLGATPSAFHYIRLDGGRLYCTLDPDTVGESHEGRGAIVSSPLSLGEPPTFFVFYKLNGNYSMGDVSVTDEKTFLSYEDDTGLNVSVVSCADIFSSKPEWNEASYNATRRLTTLTVWNGYVFEYAPSYRSASTLGWIRPDSTFSHVDLDEISFSEVASWLPRAYVTSDTIYLPCEEGLYISPIPKLF